jgi:hypothetical protein
MSSNSTVRVQNCALCVSAVNFCSFEVFSSVHFQILRNVCNLLTMYVFESPVNFSNFNHCTFRISFGNSNVETVTVV